MIADRAAGCLVGLAYGDALGAPYEYGSRPLPDDGRPRMLGGGLGNFEPGQWSDDTQMAICIARAALDADLASEDGLDAVAARFQEWFASHPPNIGVQTSRVLRDAESLRGRPAQRLRQAAARLHEQTGVTAGNGALMRTAPITLALHGNADAISATARAVAELTHADLLAGDSCVLWCLAIDTALSGAPIGVAEHVGALPAERRTDWANWIAAADGARPSTFPDNGFTVTALQAAWAGIRWSRGRGVSSFERMVHDAIYAGGDTDTVGAIAGALAGAGWGLTQLAVEEQDLLHGWPGMRRDDLVDLARQLVAARP